MAEGTPAVLAAVAEVFVPGVERDESPGAPEVAAERFIRHYLDLLAPGLADGTASLLDGAASESFDGRSFAALEPAERLSVLDGLRDHEVEDLRRLPDLLAALALAAVYGEWTGLDESGRLAGTPVGWEFTGYPGPGEGRPNLLREP